MLPSNSQQGTQIYNDIVSLQNKCHLGRTLKSRQDKDMIQAYNNIICRLTKHQKLPSLHLMDNEASVAFKANLKKPNQLVPPHTHIEETQQK